MHRSGHGIFRMCILRLTAPDGASEGKKKGLRPQWRAGWALTVSETLES